MRFALSTALVSLLSLVSLLPFTNADRPISNLGINCRGSAGCGRRSREHYWHIREFRYMLFNAAVDAYWNEKGGLPDSFSLIPRGNNTMYHRGESIICEKPSAAAHTGICLFLQGNIPDAGFPLSRIIEKLDELDKHDCKKCGSVPMGDNNDPHEMGILTSNYVKPVLCWTETNCYCVEFSWTFHRVQYERLAPCRHQPPYPGHNGGLQGRELYLDGNRTTIRDMYEEMEVDEADF